MSAQDEQPEGNALLRNCKQYKSTVEPLYCRPLSELTATHFTAKPQLVKLTLPTTDYGVVGWGAWEQSFKQQWLWMEATCQFLSLAIQKSSASDESSLESQEY